ncbi:MAG: hypothetical protein ABEJ55_08400 [Halanaeroarchaeum sp.]
MQRSNRPSNAQSAGRRYAPLPPPPAGHSLAYAAALLCLAVVVFHPAGPALLAVLAVSAVLVAYGR